MIARLSICLLLAVSGLAQSAPTAKETTAGSPVATDHQPAVVDPMDAAHELLKARKYTDAAAAYHDIVLRDPSAMRAHLGLMQSLLHSAKIEEAEEAAKSALAALPNSPPVHAAYGDVEFRAGKFAEAEAQYRAALKLDDTSSRGWFGLGRMYDMLSMHKHAQDAYSRAHSYDPDDQEIFRYWANSLPYAERLAAYKKRAGDHPQGREGDYIKLLSAAVQKKPWVLASEIKPTEIKMLPYGRELTGVYDINRDGPMTISKGYGLQVKFNDRASAVLLLDTGAGGITIGRKLAEKAGAVKIADTFMFGIGDQGAVGSAAQLAGLHRQLERLP